MNAHKKCDIYTLWNTIQLQKNKIKSYAAKWIQLETIMFKETSQSQKDKYVFPDNWQLIQNTQSMGMTWPLWDRTVLFSLFLLQWECGLELFTFSML